MQRISKTKAKIANKCFQGLLTLSLILFATSESVAAADENINNSRLIPRLMPDSEVQMEGTSPDWVKSLIMSEVCLETASADGTLAGIAPVLDHFAEMGVNCIWVTPIYDRPGTGAYTNYGPDTIFPQLTGTSDRTQSMLAMKKFVEQAHHRNIRVLFDIIVWGTRTDSQLVSRAPQFYEKKNGHFVSAYGGYTFDWKNAGLREWYKETAVKLIEQTGADGFRVDLAPDTSGYFFKFVRDALYAKGKKIVIMSEVANNNRAVFDFEENGVSGWTEKPDYSHPEHLKEQKARVGLHSDYLMRHNIVDIVKSGVGIGDSATQKEGHGGTFRFYTSNLLNHDDHLPFAVGNRVKYAYSTIFAPYVPISWIGEEWNNPRTVKNVMYFNKIDWSLLNVNHDFYEDVKKYIRIRRSYPGIFEFFPPDARQANIAKVASFREVDGSQKNNLQAYGRFRSGRAIICVPNFDYGKTASFKVEPNMTNLHLDPTATYSVKDLMTGTLIGSVNGQSLQTNCFKAEIKSEYLGLYLMERQK